MNEEKTYRWRLQDIIFVAMLCVVFGVVYLAGVWLIVPLSTIFTSMGLSLLGTGMIFGVCFMATPLDAVEIFGKGKVSPQIVAGAELAAKNGHKDMEAALAANFEACGFYSRHGVQFLTILWRPHKAERLGYRPMLPVGYYVRLSEGIHQIRRSYGLHNTNDDYKHCVNHPDSDLERLD